MDQRYFTPATVISEASWRTSPASAINASPSPNTSFVSSWICSSSSCWISSAEISATSSWIASASLSSGSSDWISASPTSGWSWETDSWSSFSPSSCAVSPCVSPDTSLKTSASDAIAVTGTPDAITAELSTSAADFLKSFHLCIPVLLCVFYITRLYTRSWPYSCSG